MKNFVAILSVLLVFTLNGTLPAADAPTQPETSIEQYAQSLEKITEHTRSLVAIPLTDMPGASDLVDIMKLRVQVHVKNPQYRKVIPLRTYFNELPQTSAWQKISEQQKRLFDFEKKTILPTRLDDYIFAEQIRASSGRMGYGQSFYAYSPEDAYYVIVGIGEIVEKYRLNKIMELTELIEQDQKFIADCEQKCADTVKEMQKWEPLLYSLKYTYSDVADAKGELFKWRRQLDQVDIENAESKATLQAVTKEMNDLRNEIEIYREESKTSQEQYNKSNDDDDRKIIAQRLKDNSVKITYSKERLDTLKEKQADIIIEQAGLEAREKTIQSKAEQIELLVKANIKYQEANAVHSASVSNINSAEAMININRKNIDNLIPLLSDDIVKLASNISVKTYPVQFR